MEGYVKLRMLLMTWLLGNGICEKEASEFADSLIELRKAEVAKEIINQSFCRRMLSGFARSLREEVIIG